MFCVKAAINVKNIQNILFHEHVFLSVLCRFKIDIKLCL